MFKATNWIMSYDGDVRDIIKNKMDELELNSFVRDDIKKVVAYAISEYGTKRKLAFSEKVADVLSQMLAEYKLVTPTTRLPWIDCTIAAAYIHNIFTADDDWTTIFDARLKLKKAFDDLNVDERLYNEIFRLVEAQYGENTPVEVCRPLKNSPGELFFWSVWFTKQLLGVDQEPVSKFVSSEPEAVKAEVSE